MIDTDAAEVERLARLAYEADITSHFDRLGTPTRARPPLSWESETEHRRDGYRAIARAVRDAVLAELPAPVALTDEGWAVAAGKPEHTIDIERAAKAAHDEFVSYGQRHGMHFSRQYLSDEHRRAWKAIARAAVRASSPARPDPEVVWELFNHVYDHLGRESRHELEPKRIELRALLGLAPEE